MHQSLPNFFRCTHEGTLSCTRFYDFGYLYPFRRYSCSKWKGVWNWAKFSMFFASKIFWGADPQICGQAFINWTCFWTCGKISQRSALGPRRSRDEKKERKTVVKRKAFRTIGLCALIIEVAFYLGHSDEMFLVYAVRCIYIGLLTLVLSIMFLTLWLIGSLSLKQLSARSGFSYQLGGWINCFGIICVHVLILILQIGERVWWCFL